MGRAIYAFDVETASKGEKHKQYAGLEPWRALQGVAHITSASLCRPDGSVRSHHRREMGDEAFDLALIDLLGEVRDQVVYCHNAVFDVAWLIASIKRSRTERVPACVRDVKWHDTMLLAKWLVNGQKAEELQISYSLANLAKAFMRDHPLLEDFVRMKEEKVDPGNDPYWERRNQMDVIMTQAMAVRFEDKLPDVQRNGYSTEARNIVPVANGWVMGVRVDQSKLEEVESAYDREQAEIIERIKINPSVLTSGKQLGHLLFTQMGLKPESFTPTGAPSTKADDIKMMGYKLSKSGDETRAKFMTDVIRYKQIATLRSKYVNGAKMALEHTGDGYMYGSPRIFGTYTGRFTYSSTTLDTYQTGIALHQLPRKAKEIRGLLLPPEGMLAYEADAMGQESRLMCVRANEPNMIMLFNNDFDFHSVTATYILGFDYHEFQEKYLSGDKVAKEYRQYGKLVNLSGNYRIGAEKLSKKGFDDYDLVISVDKTWYFLNVFKQRYAGIPIYWNEAIVQARAVGYAETFGGRRYKIHDWSGNRTWVSESSALMMPIQGSGASQKNIAIAEIGREVPEADFSLDLHDASFCWVPEDDAQRTKARLDEVLNGVDYSKYWGFEPPIKLPFESHMGDSFADLK